MTWLNSTDGVSALVAVARYSVSRSPGWPGQLSITPISPAYATTEWYVQPVLGWTFGFTKSGTAPYSIVCTMSERHVSSSVGPVVVT